MLPSSVQVVEQGLIRLVAHFTQMLVNFHRLVFAVLAGPAISGIQIKPHSLQQLLPRQNLTIEILTIPPETRTHADCCGKQFGSCIGSVATDKSSQAASGNAIVPLDSSFQPVALQKQDKLLFDKIQILITLASELITRVK